MMDGPSFTALLERCAPGAPVDALTSIVRQASGFEPLIVGTDGRKLLTVQAISKAEAIELATELEVGGERVRIGLAQIDARDLKQLGLSLADGFEPCPNVKAAAQLLAENSASLKSTKVAAKGLHARRADLPPDLGQGTRLPAIPSSESNRIGGAWDVYGQDKRASVFVYGAPD